MFRLSPRFYLVPPTDGVWEFDAEGDAPEGVALDLPMAVCAEAVVGVPPWLGGVKVYAATGSVATPLVQPVMVVPAPPAALRPRPHVCQVRRVLGVQLGQNPHAAARRLRPHLTLQVTGPEEPALWAALDMADQLGLMTPLAASYPRRNADLWEHAAALLARLQHELGDGYQVRLEDRPDWVD
jgi:hypothetical protein